MFNDYTFVFDIDGTLCPIKKKDEKYEDCIRIMGLKLYCIRREI